MAGFKRVIEKKKNGSFLYGYIERPLDAASVVTGFFFLFYLASFQLILSTAPHFSFHSIIFLFFVFVVFFSFGGEKSWAK